MSVLKKGTLWLWLLTKRLYKKPTFLAILVLIPLLVLGYGAVARQESGMLTVALYGDSDSLTQTVFAEMEQSGQLVKYVRCETPEKAELLVRTGKADAAWIFPEDLETALDTFTKSPVAKNAFVRVVQREENVMLALCREKLSGALYPYIAEKYYILFLREEFPQMENLTDAELMAYYKDFEVSGDLFAFENVAEEKVQQVHYLMSPLRGLLAVVIALGGLATAMYNIRDEENGTFNWLPMRKRIWPELAGQVVAGVNLGLAALLALMATGMAQSLGKELVVLLLYSLCSGLFCMLLRRLLGSIRLLGTATPLLIVAMLLLCPVFFDLGAMRRWQQIFPPTYYINGVYDLQYMVRMLFYGIVCGMMCLLLDLLRDLRVRQWRS